ncbi:MAG TPA: ABC transporter substrate-binding protein, partial [Pyrinomonadaceae bacterium]
MKRIFLSLLVLASLMMSFTACVDKSANGGQTTGGGDTIKVGVYGDVTGATSSFGQSTRNGIQLAFDEINAAGGVNGKKLEMIFEDDQGTPEKAKTVISKL